MNKTGFTKRKINVQVLQKEKSKFHEEQLKI